MSFFALVYPCELHCYTRDSKQPFADRLRDKVVDGTKCFSHGNDVCVDGICKVGYMSDFFYFLIRTCASITGTIHFNHKLCNQTEKNLREIFSQVTLGFNSS